MRHQLGPLSLRFATLNDLPLLLELEELNGSKVAEATLRRRLAVDPTGQVRVLQRIEIDAFVIY